MTPHKLKPTCSIRTIIKKSDKTYLYEYIVSHCGGQSPIKYKFSDEMLQNSSGSVNYVLKQIYQNDNGIIASILDDPKPSPDKFLAMTAELARVYPVLRKIVQHPENLSRKTFVDTIVMELNDNHNWTREKIAEWVDSLD